MMHRPAGMKVVHYRAVKEEGCYSSTLLYLNE